MIAAYLNPSNIVFTTVHAAVPFSSPVPCPPLSLLQDTCNTGLIFDFPHNFTLAPHEFIELMEELVGYCAKPTPGVEHLKRFCSCGHHTRGQIEEVHKFHDDLADDTADDDDAGGAGDDAGGAGGLGGAGLRKSRMLRRKTSGFTSGRRKRPCRIVCQEGLHDYFISEFHQYMMLSVAWINLWLLMLYPTFGAPDKHSSVSSASSASSASSVTGVGVLDVWGAPSDVIDVVSYVLQLVYVVEMALRIYSVGWVHFWWQPNDFYGQSKARYDFGITVVLLGILLIERLVSNQGFTFRTWPTHLMAGEELDASLFTDPARVILTLSSFRIFSNVHSIRSIFFGLLYIVPTFANIALLMVAVIDVYSMSGCFIFGGTFMYLESYEVPASNYNSLWDAWTTMYQLLVGEAWNTLMHAGIEAVGPWVTFFFLSYTILMTLLFTNLVVGIFVNANAKVTEANAGLQGGPKTTLDMKRVLTEDSVRV